MANSICFAPGCSFRSPNKPGLISGNSVTEKGIRGSDVYLNCGRAKFQSLEVKATESDKSAKRRSIICTDCEGNGAIVCSQCKGDGVNLVDHFNGQFKAGSLCWLCRGKKEILCGNCNGAGFLGGFMSTCDD